MNAFLLAAGLGTRFKPYTDILAKPAIPLLNIPMAFYNLHLMQQLNVGKVTVNIHHLPQTIKDIFLNNPAIDIPVKFSDETPQILGTGGAVGFARKELEGSGTFVMANADVVNVFSVRDALKFHQRHKAMATMVVMRHPEAGKKYGAVWVNKKNEVVDISRTKPLVECDPYHFVGVHFIEESIFKYIPAGASDINREVYLKALKAGERVTVYKKAGTWFDAGNLQDYLQATEALLKVLSKLQHQPFFLSLFRRFWKDFDRRPNVWEGENCDHLLPLGTGKNTLLDHDCKIHPSVEVSGFAVFGAHCQVGKDVKLHNVVVGPGAIIPEGTHLSNTLTLTC